MNQFLNYTVAPLSKNEIDNIVTNYLQICCPRHLQEAGQLDIEELLDIHIFKMHGFVKGISCNLGTGVEALTLPLEKRIEISERTFNGIASGDPHYRFTGCHEAFHVICHAEQMLNWGVADISNSIALAREQPPAFVKPEWQADHGGGAFLMPRSTFIPFVENLKKRRAFRRDIIHEIMRIYNVSYKAAEVRLSKLNM